MQGHKGAIGSLPETLTLEHGSTSSDSGVVEQQICWSNFMRNPSANANQEAQNISMWCMGESSSSSLPNHVSQNRVDPITEHGRSSLMKTCSEPHQHEPPTSMLSLGDVNMNITHNHTNNGHRNGPLFVQNSRSESVPQNVTVNPSTFIGIKPLNYASSSSSDPFDMENRQLPCKRRATELSIGQSSSGIESLNIFQRPVSENPPPLNTMVSEQSIPRIASGVGVSSDNHSAENSHRNVRIRINNSRLQDPLPASNISNNGQLNFSSPYSSLGLNPVVATTGENLISSSHEGQPRLRVPVLRRNLQVSSRNRSSSSRANRSISLNIGGSGDSSRTMPINVSDHPLFVQPHDIRNAAQTPVNWNLNSSGGNGNVINAVSNLGPHRGSSQYPYRRLSEILRRSLLSSTDSESGGSGGGGGQSNNLFSRIPPPVGGTSASSSQETGIPPVIGIPGGGHHHHLPHLRSLDRYVDGAFGFPYLTRTVTGGSERRGRLVSEIRNVLDLIRRGEGLRFEDVMILDQSVFYGMADIHDRHRDMRLDIDNMSYEELLALEERIGNVNTGLTEENISKCLKQRSYASVAGQTDVEPCCICQEEYNNGDDMGVLECGHEFHTSCIKQWLLQKNLCPVCKSSASK